MMLVMVCYSVNTRLSPLLTEPARLREGRTLYESSSTWCSSNWCKGGPVQLQQNGEPYSDFVGSNSRALWSGVRVAEAL